MKKLFGAIIILGLGAAGWYYFTTPRLGENGTSDQEKKVCIQVITPAKNPETGEVRNFPTPCDVPEGWEKIEGQQVQTPPPASNPPAGGPPPAPEETWQTYSSDVYGYQLEFPKSWTAAEQSSGAFVDFGPGNVQIGGGDIALDVSCIYAAGIEEGSEGSVEKKTVIYGSNTYVEEKSAATHTFQTDIPAKNQKNGCPYAMFILRKDVSSSILQKILGSFKFQ